jgi:hypothetical protein
MAGLTDDIAFYDEHREQLEADHFGKWVLVRERAIIDFFEEFESAAADAVRQFGRGPYLIRQIGAPSAPMSPSLMYRLIDAHGTLRV